MFDDRKTGKFIMFRACAPTQCQIRPELWLKIITRDGAFVTHYALTVYRTTITRYSADAFQCQFGADSAPSRHARFGCRAFRSFAFEYSSIMGLGTKYASCIQWTAHFESMSSFESFAASFKNLSSIIVSWGSKVFPMQPIISGAARHLQWGGGGGSTPSGGPPDFSRPRISIFSSDFGHFI